jgi:4-hydroxy-tetrahydrodipicolinate reductase
MGTVKVMVNGLPGSMAEVVARQIVADDRYELIPHSLTGPEITETECNFKGFSIRLIQPDGRETALRKIKETEDTFISVDYTHPNAVNPNAELYCSQGLPFVMGTKTNRRLSGHDGICGRNVSEPI